MIVTKVTNNEKQAVLGFCKNTFSWGDYVEDVWDSWIKEGNFLAIKHENVPVAICHASIYNTGKQVWIEGIRVNEHFRNKGYASKLVKECEKIGKKNNCNTAYMLIGSTNKKSLNLAQKLEYENFEKWYFYSLIPKKTKKHSVKFANYQQKLPSIIFSSNFFYVNSWRWIPLDNNSLQLLIKEKRIIYSENNDEPDGIAIITDSKHFEKTFLVTIISGSIFGLSKILLYIQNLGYLKNCKRIQILTKIKSLPDIEGLEKRFSFNLMKKKI